MRIGALVLLFQIAMFPLVAHAQGAGGFPVDPKQVGRAVFEQRCAVCHTRSGLPIKKPWGPVLSKDVVEGNEEFVRETILHGRPGSMPGFQYGLDRKEVDAVVEYLRTLPAPTLADDQKVVDVPKKVNAGRDEFYLTGSVKSVAGEKMGGIIVSTKAEGQSITSTVFTDEDGNYYFPALPAGKYHTWAQTDTYETVRHDVDLTMTRRVDFVLRPPRDFVRQLTGDQLISALPEATPDDRRIKQEFKHSCIGCHPTNYILQNKFDEDGWIAILNLMKRETGPGTIVGIDQAPNPIIQYEEKEMAAYLARMRGPGPSPMKFTVQPRPTGDAAKVAFTEYDIPVDWSWDKEIEGGVPLNDGSNWSLGAPSGLNGLRGVHDAQEDMNGNIWFAYHSESTRRTIGRIDTKTGDVKNFPLPGDPGLVAMSHGFTMDHTGTLWFNANPREATDLSAGGVMASVDSETEKIRVFPPPKGESGPGGAITMDVDPKGYVWASTPFGALRFDPKTHEFLEFKSNTTTYEGIGTTYGTTSDSEGNGWWAQFYSGLDAVSKGDVKTGKTIDVKFPPEPGVKDLFGAEQLKMYEMAGSGLPAAFPWVQGPRRLAGDHNGEVVWVCDYWSGNLARIDIHTLKVTFIAAPNPNEAPYAAAVDKDHNVWVTFSNADKIGKYDPRTSRWTEYRVPSLGSDARWISLFEKSDGTMQVILPYFRNSKIARMSFRTEADLQKLKQEVQKELRSEAQLQ
jgi:streptogramin lyase/cytochrome c5